MTTPHGRANLLTSPADDKWKAIRKAVAVSFSSHVSVLVVLLGRWIDDAGLALLISAVQCNNVMTVAELLSDGISYAGRALPSPATM